MTVVAIASQASVLSSLLAVVARREDDGSVCDLARNRLVVGVLVDDTFPWLDAMYRSPRGRRIQAS